MELGVTDILKAEISASAVRHNIRCLRDCLTPGVKLCAVVKADCYGHGLGVLWETIACESDSLAVATPQEAIALRDLGYSGQLLVLFSVGACGSGSEMSEALDELLVRDVQLTVINESEAQAVSQAALRIQRQASVHIKVDTGMGRSGILHTHAAGLIEHASTMGGVALAGVFTHMATADEADKSDARMQLARFQAVTEAVDRKSVTLHAANSAGIIDLSESHFDMVRPGIAVYGYQPSDDMHTKLPLKPALRLIAGLMQIRPLPAGSRVGYGLTHTFERETRIGLIPVGYGDGYFRSYSGETTVRIGGTDVPVCGRVSMDQLILDLTEIPDPQVGDPVEVMSPNPEAPHSVESLARMAGTIPYEVTCSLGLRVKRILVD